MVVIGTEAGKSMLFILPASYLTGVTVVVILLVSLRGNLIDHYNKAGIKCIKWNSCKPHKWASIILVTPESAVSKDFGNFINQ